MKGVSIEVIYDEVGKFLRGQEVKDDLEDYMQAMLDKLNGSSKTNDSSETDETEEDYIAHFHGGKKSRWVGCVYTNTFSAMYHNSKENTLLNALEGINK